MALRRAGLAVVEVEGLDLRGNVAETAGQQRLPSLAPTKSPPFRVWKR